MYIQKTKNKEKNPNKRQQQKAHVFNISTAEKQ